MPKKRNTRKHKISIDQKRHIVQEVSTPIDSPAVPTESNQQAGAAAGMTFSLPTNITTPHTTTKRITETVAISTENYGYLATDLVRTAVLSTAIVITEIVIRTIYH